MQNTTIAPSKTILTIVVGFLFIYLTSEWKPSLYIALFVGILGLSSDYLATKIERLWMQLAGVLSKIIPNVLMTFIFYFLLFPIALVARLLGEKDPLHLKNNSSSLFKDTNKEFEKETFEKIW